MIVEPPILVHRRGSTLVKGAWYVKIVLTVLAVPLCYASWYVITTAPDLASTVWGTWVPWLVGFTGAQSVEAFSIARRDAATGGITSHRGQDVLAVMQGGALPPGWSTQRSQK